MSADQFKINMLGKTTVLFWILSHIPTYYLIQIFMWS